MTLPSESLGVVAYAANDLRVEPVPLREPADDETVVEMAYGGNLWLRPALLDARCGWRVHSACADGLGP